MLMENGDISIANTGWAINKVPLKENYWHKTTKSGSLKMKEEILNFF